MLLCIFNQISSELVQPAQFYSTIESFQALEKSYELLLSAKEGSIEFEMFRNSTVKIRLSAISQLALIIVENINFYFKSSVPWKRQLYLSKFYI
jgi:hypothetical protein